MRTTLHPVWGKRHCGPSIRHRDKHVQRGANVGLQSFIWEMIQ